MKIFIKGIGIAVLMTGMATTASNDGYKECDI